MMSEVQRSHPSDHRTGDFILRKKTIKVDNPVSAVEEYENKYGYSNSLKEKKWRGRLAEGVIFEMVLGRPNTEIINEVALKKDIVVKKKMANGQEVIFIKSYRGKQGGYSLDSRALHDYFKLVMDNQGGDPTNPHSQLAKDLRLAIMDAMSLTDDEQVKYYTAVGTALDHTKDVRADGFIEINKQLITFDLSTRNNKEGNELGADIFISEADIALINEIDIANSFAQKSLAEKAYLEQVDSLAKKFAQAYQEKITNTV